MGVRELIEQARAAGHDSLGIANDPEALACLEAAKAKAIRWDVVTKDVAHVKLTVAKDRVTVKFPLNTSAPDQERYMDFCHKIVAAVGPVEHTLRGSFKGNYVFMHTGRRGANSRYFCEGVEGTPPAWEKEDAQP